MEWWLFKKVLTALYIERKEFIYTKYYELTQTIFKCWFALFEIFYNDNYYRTSIWLKADLNANFHFLCHFYLFLLYLQWQNSFVNNWEMNLIIPLFYMIMTITCPIQIFLLLLFLEIYCYCLFCISPLITINSESYVFIIMKRTEVYRKKKTKTKSIEKLNIQN